MLFSSWSFALFFTIVYPTFLAVRNTKLRLPVLLAASYFFYGCFNPLYPILIAYSTLVDYMVVRQMAKSKRRKIWLSISVINNLALLGVFKYGGFITGNINALLALAGIPYFMPEPGIFLPVGLSFYTFQSMACTIDYYRGRIEREKSLLSYAAFIAFFPRLVAGPIERAANLLPQMNQPPRLSKEHVADGLSLFLTGLFKKIALADYLALYVNKVYSAPGEQQAPALILATFLFAWQIYFDFSGYTDMARGLARMMGYRLMLNFDNPYLATGLGDFWNRWHISLSSWFKDYVYIPLGGNRRGRFNTYRNMFLTMVLSGLWHGAAWTFVAWGAIHALGRFVTRELERRPFYTQRVPKTVRQLWVFLFVTFAWIFFRADSIGQAGLIVSKIFKWIAKPWNISQLTDPRCPLLALALIFAVWIYQFAYQSRIGWILRLRGVRITIVILMVLYLTIFAPSGGKPFIYMQF